MIYNPSNRLVGSGGVNSNAEIALLQVAGGQHFIMLPARSTMNARSWLQDWNWDPIHLPKEMQ